MTEMHAIQPDAATDREMAILAQDAATAVSRHDCRRMRMRFGAFRIRAERFSSQIRVRIQAMRGGPTLLDVRLNARELMPTFIH